MGKIALRISVTSEAPSSVVQCGNLRFFFPCLTSCRIIMRDAHRPDAHDPVVDRFHPEVKVPDVYQYLPPAFPVLFPEERRGGGRVT